MEKFYQIHDELKRWDVTEISNSIKNVMDSIDLDFGLWKGTMELKKLDGSIASTHLNHDQTLKNITKVTNGDMNITTNVDEYQDTASQLFAGSGRRGRLVDGAATYQPKIKDRDLATLVPAFKGTILESLHKYMEDFFQHPIRIRCQNRGVNGMHQGLYWHKDNPVENRYHMPIWTNPGHILIFSPKEFKWEAGFDPLEATEPMNFVGHYVPADGRVYEMFTKDYMHAVASVGVGWYQPRWQQTRCHLSFWLAKD
jgi:hypothetical protein